MSFKTQQTVKYMTTIQLTDRQQINAGEDERKKSGKEKRIMHDLVCVGDACWITNEFLEKRIEQCLTDGYIKPTCFCHVTNIIHMIGIVCTILCIFRMDLEYVICRRQMRKSIHQYNKRSNKSGKWSSDANIKML